MALGSAGALFLCPDAGEGGVIVKAYEKLKESRAEVAELQKIRRYVDVALKAETQQQTQIKRHEHDL